MKTIHRPRLIAKGDKEMTMSQLERLKKDERELNHYLLKMKKKGKMRIAHALQKKRDMLASRIEEVEDIYIKQKAA